MPKTLFTVQLLGFTPTERIVLSSIFEWYEDDFGGDPVAWIRRVAPEQADHERVLTGVGRVAPDDLGRRVGLRRSGQGREERRHEGQRDKGSGRCGHGSPRSVSR